MEANVSDSSQQELVLRLRFGQGRPATIQEVADALGLTVRRARRIEGEALRRLRLSTLDSIGSGLCDWDEV
jgi:DNA-directed RNA polymerase sigma subunit (sigma70/sigma32)